MLAAVCLALVQLIGAHPLGQPYHLPVSPLLAADAAAALVLLTALAVPERRRPGAAARDPGCESWRGRLSGPQVLTRCAAIALLALAIAAGRLGVDDELENLAPALVVGAVWPLMTLASIAAGPLWRWVDPWDALARALSRGDDADDQPTHVWPAVVLATAWVWYLGAYDDPLDPRSVGALLALYTLVTVAGCLALGRARWLGMGEPFGIVLSVMALLPRGRLGGWDPPRGMDALLGALAGGVLFGAVRRSELWGELNTAAEPQLFAAAGVIASCALGAGLLMLMSGATERSSRAAVARAAVPAVAGVILAVALDRNRLFTSVQLLPGLLGDPLGRGWDVLGRADAGLDPDPLGITGLLVLQLGVLVTGYAAAAVVLGRRVRRRARLPAAAGLSLLAGLSVIAVASH
jgi:hypothetical protein